MKIPCTGERREEVSQAEKHVKYIWSLKVKILGEVSSWEKASGVKMRERMVRNLVEEGQWGLLGWGKECDLYPKWHGRLLMLFNQGTCLMCVNDKSPQVWGSRVGAGPHSSQRAAAGQPQAVTAGMRGDIFWRHSWQELLMALEVGGRGEGRKVKDTFQFWARTAERCSLVAGETRGRTSFSGEKKDQMLFRYVDFKRPVQFPRREVK